ncbi:MAG: YXWGXW repeat-containing protein, partial [Myxococcota bacterium]
MVRTNIPLVLAATLGWSCASTSQADRSAQSVAKLASTEMSCPQGDMVFTKTTETQWHVSGCGQRASYRGGCEGDTCSWSRQPLPPPAAVAVAASRAPVPPAPPPPSPNPASEPTNPCPPPSAAPGAGSTSGEMQVELQAACQMSIPQTDGAQTAPQAPPAQPIAEEKTAAPADGYVWVLGRWYWTGRNYVWLAGYWVPAEPGYVYVAGRWTSVGGVWTYAPIRSPRRVGAGEPRPRWFRPPPIRRGRR